MDEKVYCDVCGAKFGIFLENSKRAGITRYFFICSCGKEYDAYFESEKTKKIQELYSRTHRTHIRKKLKKQWKKEQSRCKAVYQNNDVEERQ